MNARQFVALLLAAGLLIPTAGVTVVAQENSTPAPGGDTTAAGSGTDDAAANYTRLYIDDRHAHLELRPGETETVSVVVENGEDDPVDVDPHLFIPPRGERPIEQSWVTIESGDTTIGPDEEREFEITVAVPEAAELNSYQGVVAFTDERVNYPGQPPRPVHGLSLHVDVWKPPTVQVTTDRHHYAQVQAGESFTRDIVIENTGDEAIPVNPKLVTEDRTRHVPPGDRETLERSWLEIDAPSEVAANSTATVTVTVTPPADADRGDYRAEIDLGLKDPARPDRSTYWQEVGLRFQVWSPPEEPFETTFEVSEATERIGLELSTGHHGPRETDETPGFDVTFVTPNGETVDATRVAVVNSGGVSLGEDRSRASDTDETYSPSGEDRTFRYQVEDPASGSWSVRIMPKNTMHFRYEITRTEAS